MKQGQQIDLSGLRDIHMPEGVSFFPLAPIWWLLISLVLVPVIVYVLATLFLYIKRTSIRFLALHELKNINREYKTNISRSIQVSVLMKRIAIRKYGNDKVADLYGGKWGDFIRKTCPNADKKALQSITESAYVNPSDFITGNMEDIYRLAAEFIRRNT